MTKIETNLKHKHYEIKTKTLLFSAAALLAVSNVNAQTDITPERFVFANQELGEYKIDYFNAGSNPADDFQLASDNSDNGFFLLCAGAPNVGTSGEEAGTAMTKAIQSATTIIDLGGEIGNVFCSKGTKSLYEEGAQNLPSETFIGWYNYSFYLPKTTTPQNGKVRIRMVFNIVHNNQALENTLCNMYIAWNGKAVSDIYSGFKPSDFMNEDGSHDVTKWEVYEFDADVQTFPMRLKMEIQQNDWVNGAILIKEIKFIANPEGDPVQGEFVTYDSGTSNVAETILDQSAYSVNGNNVTFLQAGEVFGLNGIKVATVKAGETVQLNAGFYIVRTNGQAAKLVIR